MKALCQKLGYTFNDMKLLETALTHPSYGGDHHVPHYQRLEFLGDAVLELAVSRYLYFEFPEVDEGKVVDDARMVEDLGADSANLMMLIMDLETEFNMTVEDDALGTIKTVGDIVDYIQKKG